ncbi:NAD(P)H-dependent oxidoreductase [Brachybacterium sp. EF45031]|uniref:CE1759 family FMN reductase n=1 Tax=Brachybacterium sillae TaxID=2810536 RepID=UPI00217ED533|nr:CE1759 family FMN reductase [Brachybacterium sillae]MCS6711514.1 NAD(P)H-dependent oxidoreductase [Brachybacterium sillae]
MSARRIVVLTAGLSTPSTTRMLGDQLARAARDALGARGDQVQIHTVELREMAHELTDALLTRVPGENLAAVIEQIRAADAVIAVSPIFNTGASALFKMFFDAVDVELWQGRTVLLGATAGSARHSLALEYALRPMFVYLKAQVVPTAVFAASEDFGGIGEESRSLADRARCAGEELAELVVGRTVSSTTGSADARREDGDGNDSHGEDTAAERSARGRGLDAEFSDFTPMDQLLGRG